jgi:hypothetical protein
MIKSTVQNSMHIYKCHVISDLSCVLCARLIDLPYAVKDLYSGLTSERR